MVITCVIAIAFFITACSPTASQDPLRLEIHSSVSGGHAPQVGDIVTVNLSYRLKDTVLFDSRTLEVPMEFPLLAPMFEGDLYAGLSQLRVGDSASITVVADSFFIKSVHLERLPAYVKKGELLYYQVRLLKALSRATYDSLSRIKVLEKQRIEQEQIHIYLTENNLTFTDHPSGLVTIPILTGDGKLPDTGDMCQVYLQVSLLNGDTLFSNFEDDAFDIEFGKPFDTQGLMEGLGAMKEGSITRLLVPSIIGVGTEGFDGLPGYTTLDYKLYFKQIRPLAVVKEKRRQRKEAKLKQVELNKRQEPQTIQQYLQDNQLPTDSLATGLYVITKKTGTGQQVPAGATVKIHYIQYNSKGKVLKSSYKTGTPYQFQLGTGAVIAGWEQAVSLMHKGEITHLIVPSKLGYGKHARGKEIPSYSPLFFDIELLDFE